MFSLQFSYTDLSACMWTSESELKSWCVLEQITSIYTAERVSFNGQNFHGKCLPNISVVKRLLLFH